MKNLNQTLVRRSRTKHEFFCKVHHNSRNNSRSKGSRSKKITSAVPISIVIIILTSTLLALSQFSTISSISHSESLTSHVMTSSLQFNDIYPSNHPVITHSSPNHVASSSRASSSTISLNLTSLLNYLDYLNMNSSSHRVNYVDGDLKIQVDGQLTEPYWLESPIWGPTGVYHSAFLPSDVIKSLYYPNLSDTNKTSWSEIVNVPTWFLVKIRGLWNDTHVSLAIQWNDTTPNIEKNTWHYQEENHSWYNDHQEEDSASIFFINHKCVAWGGSASHISLLAAIEDNGSMPEPSSFFTSLFDAPSSLDLIQWRAALTDPLGYADDLYMNVTLVSQLESTSNLTSLSRINTRILPDGNETAGFTPNSYNYQTIGNNAFNATDRPYWDENGSIINHATDQFENGEKISGYRLIGKPRGSRGEVLAKGRFNPSTKQWTVELVIPHSKIPLGTCGEDNGGFILGHEWLMYIEDGNQKIRYWNLMPLSIGISLKYPNMTIDYPSNDELTPWFTPLFALPPWMEFIPLIILFSVISIITRRTNRQSTTNYQKKRI